MLRVQYILHAIFILTYRVMRKLKYDEHHYQRRKMKSYILSDFLNPSEISVFPTPICKQHYDLVM